MNTNAMKIISCDMLCKSVSEVNTGDMRWSTVAVDWRYSRCQDPDLVFILTTLHIRCNSLVQSVIMEPAVLLHVKTVVINIDSWS